MGSLPSKRTSVWMVATKVSWDSCPGAHPTQLYQEFEVTSPGVPSRYFMWSMIEDLRKETVDEIRVRDEYVEATTFLDFFGYVGDYLAGTDIIDVRVHNTRVHFHLLFLLKYDNFGNVHYDFWNDPCRNSTKFSLRRSAQRC